VSVAIGQPFESRLEVLRASAMGAGFDNVVLWRETDLLADPVLQTRLADGSTFREAFEILRHERFDRRALTLTQSFRPFCAAFKMVALWRALQQSAEGDVVMWADASRYFSNVTLQPRLLRAAVDVLRGAVPPPPAPSHVAARWRSSPWFERVVRGQRLRALAVDSAWGLLTCSGWDCETDLYTWNGLQQVINDVTRQQYAELIGTSDLLQVHAIQRSMDRRRRADDHLRRAARRGTRTLSSAGVPTRCRSARCFSIPTSSCATSK
jgi:hypothetical protein